jgi:L-2-amino-thiazoline-4-carboxylic acid hydrolase
MLEDQLRRDLNGAFQNRALLYRDIYREMAAEFGAEAAERVLSRAIYARGKATAEVAFAGYGPQDACGLGDAFLAASPDEGRMFPTDVTREPGSISFKVKQCPLKTAWLAAGTPPEEMATLCRIAGRFDNGLFEHSGAVVETETWREGVEGCCRITLRNR